MTARRRIKAFAERLLASAPSVRVFGRVPADGLLVLAYHNVISARDAAGADASLHLPVSEFASQLEVLEREADIVSLRSVSGSGRRPRVAITFDDAYAGAVQNALPLLARRQWPVTVFVSPGMLGGRSFWWDCVRRAGSPFLPADFRRRALEVHGGRDANVRTAALDEGLVVAEPPLESRTATEQDLRDALEANPHLTLGAHTWSHVCLPTVGSEEASLEIRRSLEWLQAFGTRGVPFLAYPYGSHSAAVHAIATSAGAERAYRVDGGWSRPGGGPLHAMPRLNVPAGMSPAGLTLRLHAIVPSQ